MNGKMDRSHAVLSNSLELDAEDSHYWAEAGIKEKLQTITYLRECFYGPEATTGRLQRLYRIIERASGRLQDLADIEKIDSPD